VVDGMSDDGFEEFAFRNSSHITHLVRESDEGIYYAWNKALPLLTKGWVLFLGAGDELFDPYVVERALTLSCSSNCIFYGNVHTFDLKHDFVDMYSRIDSNGWGQFMPIMPHHQGVLHPTSLFNGRKFDTTYRIAADGHLILSALKDYRLSYVDINIATMSLGGLSTSPASLPIIFKENVRITQELCIKLPPIWKRYGDLKLFIKVLLYRILADHVKHFINLYRLASFRKPR
jgi:glycosyltransferase involved in cell wall biosynthesis